MPRGVPTINSASSRLSSAAEELLQRPQPELLGTIPSQVLDPPAETATTWVSEDEVGTPVPITVTEPPPPWEVDARRDHTDARNYIQCPENVMLRWANPNLVKQIGLRDWKIVPATGHPWFRLLNSQMQSPDNTVRKGGEGGDFLVWMYQSWYAQRKTAREARNAQLTQASVDRHQQVQDQMDRGAFGPYIKSGGGQHPTRTIADIRTLESKE